MKLMRMLVCLLSAVTLSLGIFCSQSDAAASVEKKDDRAYLFESLRAMEKVENGLFELWFEANTPLGSASVKNTTEFYGIQNGVVKTVINGAFHPIAGKSEKFSMLQYMQVEKDKMTIYSQADDKWTKSIMANAVKASDNTFDQAVIDRLIKSAVIKDENEGSVSIQVSLDSQEMKKLYNELMKEVDKVLEEAKASDKNASKSSDSKALLKGVSDKDLAAMKEAQAFVTILMNSIDNVEFHVVIDKKTKYFQAFYCDLSKPLQNALITAIDSLKSDEKEKNSYKALAQNTAVVLQGDFSKFNQVKKFNIPKDVIKNAVEEKLITDKPQADSEKKKE